MLRVLTCLALTWSLSVSAAWADWNRFRGPAGAGAVDGPAVPTTYSTEKNLAWRTELPGKGVSSPIISGDRVYLTAYTGYGLSLESPGDPKDLVRHLLAFDRAGGQELWRASLASSGGEDPFQGFITQHGYASSTPVTDGERIYALFGKTGLVAFDRDGKELWRRALGTQSDAARWGDASSPVLVDGVVVVNAGVLGRHVAGVDKLTGEVLWSISDENYTNSWSTPAVYRSGDTVQVLVHFPSKIMGVEPKSGEVVWHATTPLDDATSPSIVIHGDVAYLMGSRAGHAQAVKLGGQGDVSKTHVLWQSRVRAGITTPVFANGALYWTSSGMFMALDTKTGEELYRARLPRLGGPTGGFPNADYSSPIAVGGTVLLFTRNGESYAIEGSDTFNVLAHNAAFTGDASSFRATPAASGGELFMRSDAYLYKFAAEPASTPSASAP
ncbi:MAG: PQQ-binding-like beta-propeller repeat protein [Acidobacteriota bacterium]